MTDFKALTGQFKPILAILSANEDEGSGSFCEKIMVFRITPMYDLGDLSK